MKRQMKIAAVVSATALLAIGASFTSMAAAKTGTWRIEDGEYRCYDKNGVYYEDEFCYDGNKEFYVGEDGYLVRNAWVEHDSDMYYIGSDGSKTVNDWKELTPYEDDEADYEWFYFNASGKRVENATATVEGKTYYFDEVGRVLYGWVVKADFRNADDGADIEGLIYCDPETGAYQKQTWVEAYEPGINAEEDDLNDYTQSWYYLGATGAAKNAEKVNSINGETYIFDEDGKMLSGWIEFNDELYYACREDGHVKKNKWVYDWANGVARNADNEQNWFWIQKDGTVFIPTTTVEMTPYTFLDGSATAKADVFEAGDALRAGSKVINNERYFFDNEGKMLSGFLFNANEAAENDDELYYLGDATDGAMKTGLQTIADEYGDTYKFFFGTKENEGHKIGVGLSGSKNNKLYDHGFLVKANNDYDYEVVTVVTGAGERSTYIVDNTGDVETARKQYKDDGEIVIDATGVEFRTTDDKYDGSIVDPTKLK